MSNDITTPSRRHLSRRSQPISFRFSAEDTELLKQLSEELQLPQVVIMHLALEDFARKQERKRARTAAPDGGTSRGDRA